MRNSDSGDETDEEGELFTDDTDDGGNSQASKAEGPFKFMKKVAKLTRRISKSSFSEPEEPLPSQFRPALGGGDSVDTTNQTSTQHQPKVNQQPIPSQQANLGVTQQHRYRRRNEHPDSRARDKLQYNFNHAKRGVAILIVNYKFKNKELDRPYATNDKGIIADLLGALNFEIKPVINKNTNDLMLELRKITRELDRDVDCIACLVSTHGYTKEKHHVMYTYNGSVDTHEIIHTFREDKCPQLAGKPKLFFIQACRSLPDIVDGSDADPGTFVNIRKLPNATQTHQHQGTGDFKDSNKDTSRQDGGQIQTEKEINAFSKTMERDSMVAEPNISSTHSISNLRNVIDDIPFADDDDGNDKTTLADDYFNHPRRPGGMGQRHTALAGNKSNRPQDWKVLSDMDFCSIPCYEDFLVMFSSAPERIAWADDYRGGWLPQCMYKAIRKLVKEDFRIDLLQALTEVNGKMTIDMETKISGDLIYDKGKATACIYHKLTKDIIITPKARLTVSGRHRNTDVTETPV